MTNDRFEKDKPRDTVYKIKCDNCAWVHNGQTDRALETKIGEH